MPRIPEYNRQNIARHLRLGRQTRGFKIERIARSFRYPVSVIEDWEAGRLLPLAVELHFLCRWYGLNISAVFWPPQLKVVNTTVIGARNPSHGCRP